MSKVFNEDKYIQILKKQTDYTMKLQFLICTIIFCASADNYKDFAGYKVLRANAASQKGFEALGRLYENDDTLDFWTLPALDGYTDVMVPPEYLIKIEKYLHLNNIPYATMMENVGEIIAEQRKKNLRNQKLGIMNWDDYQTLEVINNWLQELSSQYPHLMSIQSIGNSTEGRPIYLAKVSTGGNGKPALFIDATIHAREHISAATVTFIINEVVVNSHKYTDLLEKVDLYIIPIINVDGYEFTFTSNRMWRKTRSVTGLCIGADANRNFGFMWNSCSGCSSGSPCTETYRGSVPYSEPEAAALKDFILNSVNVNWQAFITVHSYGQYFVSPWGYTSALPSDYQELKTLSDLAAGNITAVYGTRYSTGSSAAVIYPTDGTSQDWAKGEGGFKYVYTAELRDTGRYGFLLPAEQIVPTATETWAGFQVVARHIASLSPAIV